MKSKSNRRAVMKQLVLPMALALAVAAGAGVHHGASVGLHLDTSVLARAHTAGDLDVGAHTDTQLLHSTAGTALRLLGTEVGVASLGESLVDGTLVVAHVVGLL